VVSKLELYVRATADMNTSDDVVDALADRLRGLCDAAAEQARAAGRKTVMARDFKRSRRTTVKVRGRFPPAGSARQRDS
jgi:histone H3/H4